MDTNYCKYIYSYVLNRSGGWNKRGGLQISAKIKNEKAGKNAAIRNFIDIKSPNDLVKI